MQVRVITRADIGRCPKGKLQPAHYRDDGSCRCDEHDDARAALRIAMERQREVTEAAAADVAFARRWVAET